MPKKKYSQVEKDAVDKVLDAVIRAHVEELVLKELEKQGFIISPKKWVKKTREG